MITDLEVFEIITNLYPDKFPRGDDSDWDGVLEFALETFDGNLSAICFSVGIHPFYSFIASAAVVLSGAVMFGFVWSNEE